MKRKYNAYKVVVNYSNGDSKVVKCDSEYKGMMSIYRSAKQEFIEDKDCISVEFYGIGENGVKIMFSKKFETKESIVEAQREQVANSPKDREVLFESLKNADSFVNLAKQMSGIANKMKERSTQIENDYKKANRHQQAILHQIEHSVNKEDYEKIEIFNDLMSLRRDRRKVSDELEAIKRSGFDDVLKCKINAVNYKCSEYIQSQKELGDAIDEVGMENFEYVKEVKVAHINNLECQLNHQRNKYPKVEFDEKKMTIRCYQPSRFQKYIK